MCLKWLTCGWWTWGTRMILETRGCFLGNWSSISQHPNRSDSESVVAVTVTSCGIWLPLKKTSDTWKNTYEHMYSPDKTRIFPYFFPWNNAMTLTSDIIPWHFSRHQREALDHPVAVGWSGATGTTPAWPRCLASCKFVWTMLYGYGSIPIDTFLVAWTSIYQLFWCSPGIQGFDPSPYIYIYIYY